MRKLIGRGWKMHAYVGDVDCRLQPVWEQLSYLAFSSYDCAKMHRHPCGTDDGKYHDWILGKGEVEE